MQEKSSGCAAPAAAKPVQTLTISGIPKPLSNEFEPQVVHETNQPLLFYLYQMIDEAFDHRPFEEAYVAAGGSKSIRNADFLANMRAGVALSMCIIGGQVLARISW
jgi:hypothetical protein